MFEVDDVRIRSLLVGRGLTVTQFAARAGINALTARKMLNSGAKVNIIVIGKVAKFFGVDSNDILKKEQSA